MQVLLLWKVLQINGTKTGEPVCVEERFRDSPSQRVQRVPSDKGLERGAGSRNIVYHTGGGVWVDPAAEVPDRASRVGGI